MMQITRPLRLIAATLTLFGFAGAAGAAVRTQAANVLPEVALSASGVTDAPTAPRGDLLLANDGNIYFVSSAGGKGGGAIGKLAPDGTLSVLYASASSGEGVSSYARLVQGSDGNLYGTTYLGGEHGAGVVFRVTLAGTYTVLYSFDDARRAPKLPYTGLVQAADGYLYGTTLRGGEQDKGTVFRIATDGTGFTVLHEFDGGAGENPEGTLVVGDDGALYGTTLQGGADNRGTIYSITTAGDFHLLFSFPRLSEFNTNGLATNTVGANPRAALLNLGGVFYGTAYQGGEHGFGTVFRVTSAGEVSVVHAFTGPSTGAGFPLSGLSTDGAGNLYGTTERGGSINRGTAYRIDAAGAFTLLHSFGGSAVEGMQPYAGLLLANASIYAATFSDLFAGGGAIAKLDLGTEGVLPVDVLVSATDITVGSSIEVSWNAPADATCTRISFEGSTTWTGATTVSGTESVTPSTAGIYTYGLSCTDAASVVRNAYATVVVRALPREPVDGGRSGGGALSLPLLALLAALLARKYLKETRSPCP